MLRAALDEGLKLANKPDLTEQERGELYAYFDILDWGQQQMELHGVTLADQALMALDPYSLMTKRPIEKK